MLLPYAILGAHVEDTVSSSLDGEVAYIHRAVVLPAAVEMVAVSFSVGEERR